MQEELQNKHPFCFVALANVPQAGYDEIRSMSRSKQRFDANKEIRAIARERVGRVPASRPIPPKLQRAKPKHKKPMTAEEEA
jgi:hypothetical protein